MDYKENVIALLNSKELSQERKEKLESIFPELKESEDETMRKEIINYFEHYPNIIVKRERRNDWIAWLEKQGEKQEWSEEDESMRTRCIGILGKCYNLFKHISHRHSLNLFEFSILVGELPTKVEEELNRLKSLKPQNTWKPNDEHGSCNCCNRR